MVGGQVAVAAGLPDGRAELLQGEYPGRFAGGAAAKWTVPQAQRAPVEARAAYWAYRGGLPKWAEPVPERALADGTVVPAEPGWSEEQREQEARLLEAERQAAQAVWSHEHWGQLPTEDVVEARTALKHIDDEAA